MRMKTAGIGFRGIVGAIAIGTGASYIHDSLILKPHWVSPRGLPIPPYNYLTPFRPNQVEQQQDKRDRPNDGA